MSLRNGKAAVAARVTGTPNGVGQGCGRWPVVCGDGAGAQVVGAVAIVLAAILSSPAAAQISEPQEPGTGVPEVPLALPEGPPPEYSWNTHLTGDWGGLRNTLSEKGF